MNPNKMIWFWGEERWSHTGNKQTDLSFVKHTVTEYCFSSITQQSHTDKKHKRDYIDINCNHVQDKKYSVATNSYS